MANYLKYLYKKYKKKISESNPDRGDYYIGLWLISVIIGCCYIVYMMATGVRSPELMLYFLAFIVLPVPVWVCEKCVRVVWDSVSAYKKWKYEEEEAERKEKDKQEYLKNHPELIGLSL